jgi:hypothetical protein
MQVGRNIFGGVEGMVSHRFIDSGNIIFRILGWGGGFDRRIKVH